MCKRCAAWRGDKNARWCGQRGAQSCAPLCSRRINVAYASVAITAKVSESFHRRQVGVNTCAEWIGHVFFCGPISVAACSCGLCWCR